ncbi:YihY/virulence factor BrkB family protein [Shinella yambaruensis]|uniref:Ribonuclease n=1 Tax=Shinella yambaruensis TaxID=415996 RepID=A0ABQ5ZTC0_9HYPH|nr:YihY/virulence factor BrkB family protein [Shinella yambaruensis]MCJ8023823.1 YihY/virulence factor BrkB family protein [Shinella yambaruensis]MCU7979027.1 YihY/virulence factor BrkB family protein [Shinella yambaruensis]GLR54266.1 ribonuclease [Shinella yambaruensis]
MEGFSATSDPKGRRADSPGEIPALGLRDVAWRLYDSLTTDRILLIAAGVTFYLLLSIFPAISVFVSLYGLVADPSSVVDRLAFFGSAMPEQAFELILGQLRSLTSAPQASLSATLLGSLAIALWSANAGMKALFEAMNVAYGETEKRGFIRLNLTSLSFTFASLVLVVLIITLAGIVPAMLDYLWLGRWTELIIRLARWPLLLALIAVAIMSLYRLGPSREPAKLRWLSWGAVFSTGAWLAAALAITFYLGHIADYNATYGALGASIGFMVWVWVSVIIVILGAELNAELEHQTARDSTTGPPEEMGRRGAYMADTIGADA